MIRIKTVIDANVNKDYSIRFGKEDEALGQTPSVLSRPVQRKTLTQGLDQDLTQLEKEINRLTELVRQKTETVSRKSQEL